MKLHEVVTNNDGSWSCSTCGAGGISKRTAESHGEIAESVRTAKVAPKHVIRESTNNRKHEPTNMELAGIKLRQVKAFQSLGLTEAEARIAAGWEDKLTK